MLVKLKVSRVGTLFSQSAGAVIDVSPQEAERLFKAQQAEAVEEAPKPAKRAEPPNVPQQRQAPEPQSPVADLNADEAKDKISRMTSEDKLKSIESHDPRTTVQKAAQDRLAGLKEIAGGQPKGSSENAPDRAEPGV